MAQNCMGIFTTRTNVENNALKTKMPQSQEIFTLSGRRFINEILMKADETEEIGADSAGVTLTK